MRSSVRPSIRPSILSSYNTPVCDLYIFGCRTPLRQQQSRSGSLLMADGQEHSSSSEAGPQLHLALLCHRSSEPQRLIVTLLVGYLGLLVIPIHLIAIRFHCDVISDCKYNKKRATELPTRTYALTVDPSVTCVRLERRNDHGGSFYRRHLMRFKNTDGGVVQEAHLDPGATLVHRHNRNPEFQQAVELLIPSSISIEVKRLLYIART